MENICGIVDFDGCHTQEFGFLTREFGYIGMNTSDKPMSYRYDLSQFWPNLSKKSRKTAYFCEKNIHGLRFKPKKFEVVKPYNQFERDVRNFYSDYASSEKYIVAFKGGCVEKNVLQKLEVPFVNIEIYDVPKYDTLNVNGEYNRFTCGYHDNVFHCPRAEVKAFKDFLQSRTVM
jgi:hypothetical protein